MSRPIQFPANGRIYEVGFRYTYPTVTKLSGITEDRGRGPLSCTATITTNQGLVVDEVVSGSTDVGVGGRYFFLRKEVGRKIALRRALGEMSLTKPQRREAWVAYFDRRGR